jgi:molybdenum cofactor biosynthesis enzyme
LTLYDMLKYKDKQMEIGEIHVVEKTGGTSGDQSWAKSKSES